MLGHLDQSIPFAWITSAGPNGSSRFCLYSSQCISPQQSGWYCKMKISCPLPRTWSSPPTSRVVLLCLCPLCQLSPPLPHLGQPQSSAPSFPRLLPQSFALSSPVSGKAFPSLPMWLAHLLQFLSSCCAPSQRRPIPCLFLLVMLCFLPSSDFFRNHLC